MADGIHVTQGAEGRGQGGQRGCCDFQLGFPEDGHAHQSPCEPVGTLGLFDALFPKSSWLSSTPWCTFIPATFRLPARCLWEWGTVRR